MSFLVAVSQWKKDDVGVWLKQLSPTLYDHYSALFAKHDVTGIYSTYNNLINIVNYGCDEPT